MTQDCVCGLFEKTGPSVRTDISEDSSIISEDLKTFRETTEAPPGRPPNPTAGSKHPEGIEKIRQLLDDMEKRIARNELAKFQEPQEPPEAAKLPATPAPSSPSATKISYRTPGDGWHPPEQKESAKNVIYPMEAALKAGIVDFGKFQKWNKA